MSKLRFAKITILISLFGIVFYLVVYGYEVFAPGLAFTNGELDRAKYILGFMIATVAVWLTNQVSHQIYLSLRQVLIKLSLADFVLGIISSLIGLVLGALASVPLAAIPAPWSWMLSLGVVILTTALAIWAFNLKKQTIIDWFNSLHFLQRNQSTNAQDAQGAQSASPLTTLVNPMVLDTSAIIDQRIGEIIKSGFLYGTILLPAFILEELQQVADSSLSEKRKRGRLGLKLLQQIKRSKKVSVVTLDDAYPDIDLVDSKLIQLAVDYTAKIITCDYNLNAVAKVRGVSILNINELAIHLRHQYLPGEVMSIKVVHAGKEDGQGLGYLTDGTLVVVQEGKPYIGKEISVEIQRILQNPAGRMLFVKTLSERKRSKAG